MEKLYDAVFSVIKNNFYKKSALAASLILISFILLTLTQFGPTNIYNPYFLVSWFCVVIAIILYWTFSRDKIKSTLFCPEGKTGIVIAIQQSSSEKYEELKYNFIEQIESQLESDDFWVRIVDFKDCRKIQTHKDAENYLRRAKSNIIIFGKALETGKHVTLNLNAVLIHPTVPIEMKQTLAEQLSELIPNVQIQKDQLIDEFNMTSQWVSYYSSYFIAKARLWANDLEKAQSLFEKIIHDVSQIKRGAKALFSIKQYSVDVLYDIYVFRSRALYSEYCNSRNIDSLLQADIYIDLSNTLRPNEENYLILKPIFLFLLNRATNKARELLLRVDDRIPQKHYSLAFLSAYDGKLNPIFKLYRRALKSDDNEALIKEIVDFIEYILKVEPDKIELHVCLSIIQKHTGDFTTATNHISWFLELSQNAFRLSNIRKLCEELKVDPASAASLSRQQSAVSS